MKINLDILEDELEGEGAKAYTGDDLTLDIDKFEMFKLASNLSPTTAYLIDANALELNHTLLPVKNWICCGTPSDDIVRLIPGNLLVLPHRKADISTLFDLETLLKKFTSWSEALNVAALRRESYEGVLAPLAHEVFRNPFLLFNPEDRGAILTGELPSNTSDENINMVLESLGTEVLSADLSLAKEYEKEGLPLLLKNESGVSYLITNIYVKGVRYGKIVHFDTEKPFSKGYRALAHYYCQFMEALTKNGISSGAIGAKESTFLIELINKPHVNKSWLDYQIRKNGWDSETGFRLIMVDNQQEAPSESQKATIKEHFTRAFSNGTVFETKGRMACLISGHNAQARSDEEIQRRIASAFSDKHLMFGVSMVFPDLSRLRHYANQCQHLLDNFDEYSRLKDEEEERVRFYDSDFFFFDFFKTYGIDIDYRWTIHPGVEKLARYDEENGTDNIKFLETYIETGCNSKATAALLFIHQNTVLYRLERIKEICKIEIKDYRTTAPQFFHILFSCKTVVFDRMKRAHS